MRTRALSVSGIAGAVSLIVVLLTPHTTAANAQYCPRTLEQGLSNPLFMKNLIDSSNEFKEVVTVTTKQYLAVAEDVLRKVSPDLVFRFLPLGDEDSFSVFINDLDYKLH